MIPTGPEVVAEIARAAAENVKAGDFVAETPLLDQIEAVLNGDELTESWDEFDLERRANPQIPIRGMEQANWEDAQRMVKEATAREKAPYGTTDEAVHAASTTDDHPRYFYHVSKAENRESIAATGLEAGRSLGGRMTRVYLATEPRDLRPSTDEAAKDQYRVDTQGLRLRPDPEHPEGWAIAHDDIPRDRLKLVGTSHPDGLQESWDEFDAKRAAGVRDARLDHPEVKAAVDALAERKRSNTVLIGRAAQSFPGPDVQGREDEATADFLAHVEPARSRLSDALAKHAPGAHEFDAMRHHGYEPLTGEVRVEEAWGEAARQASIFARRAKAKYPGQHVLGVTPFRPEDNPHEFHASEKAHQFEADVADAVEREGMHLDSLRPAAGVWGEDPEPSYVLKASDGAEAAGHVMDRLGAKYDQDGVIRFQGATHGKSARYVSNEPVSDAAEASAAVAKAGLPGATIRPDGRLEVIDLESGEPEKAIKLFASLGMQYGYHPGHGELREAEKHYKTWGSQGRSWRDSPGTDAPSG